jgi:hypothetical protein
MRCLVFLLLALQWLARAALAADEYPIQLDRLPPAGSVIEVTSQTEQEGDLGAVLARPNRWGVTGKYKTVASLSIRITIDEVDADGRTTAATYRIGRCEITSEQGRTGTDLKGQTFQVSVSDGRRMYLQPTGDGGYYVLDPPRASIFDLAVPLRFFQGEAGLDAMFGATEPKKKGDKWSSDPAALARSLAYLGGDEEHLQGESVLKKATAKLLTLEHSLRLSGLKLELPDGYGLAADELAVQFTTALPTDAALPPTQQSIVKATRVAGTINGQDSVEWMRESGRAKYKLAR